MKILNINSYYLSSTVHHSLWEALSQDKHEILSYVPVYEGYNARPECESLGTEGNVLISSCFKKNDRYMFHNKQKKIFKDLVCKYDFKTIDVVHAHSLFTNGYLAYKLNQLYQIPYLVTVRDTDINQFFKKRVFLRSIGNKILKNADRVVFLSESYLSKTIDTYVHDDIKLLVKEKSVVVPNGISDYWHDNKPENIKDKPDNRINLLYVGAINRRKNVLMTVNALEELVKRGFDPTLTVVGRIEDSAIYDRLVRNTRVRYQEQMPFELLLEEYRKAHVFVMPSLTESFGLVYAEALSQGVPVIYSEGEGFDNQFAEGFVGYHVNPKSSSDIMEKILMIIEDYKEIASRCLQSSILFRWNDISKRYMDIYKDLIR